MRIVFVLTGLIVGGVGAVRMIGAPSVVDGYFIGALGTAFFLFGLFTRNN